MSRVMGEIMVSANGFTSLHQLYLPRPYFQHFRHCLNLNSSQNVYKKSVHFSSGSVKMVANERERVGFEAAVIEQTLPPWGNSETCNDLGFQPNSLNLKLNQSEVVAQEKVMLDVSSVHFLEETDEEELSKRILVLSRTNKVRSALELLRSMELSGLRPNFHACNSLLSCLLRNGLLGDGLRVFEFIKTRKRTTGHTYSLVLKAVADAKGCDTALQMFREMEKDHEVKNGFDAIVYNTMISVCGRVSNWLETISLWRSMKENGHTGTRITYCLLVSIFARCGRNELALDAYGEMVQNKFEPGKDIMQAVIGASAKEGKWDFALSVFQSMLQMGLKPNAVACNALINSLGKAGEIKLAFRVFDTMKSLGHLQDTYTWNALLSALYRANRHDDALRLFESIKRDQDSQLNSHLYNSALISCSKLGLWERALQLLWQMEANGMPVSAASYNLVISACETARKPNVAVQVYEHMVHQKCSPDIFTHLSLIRVCIWGSLWNEVEEILDQVAPDASLYNAAIQGMCLRGRIDSAKKLYAKMQNYSLQPDGKTRALMLQNLRKHSVKHNQKPPSRHKKRTRLSSL